MEKNYKSYREIHLNYFCKWTEKFSYDLNHNLLCAKLPSLLGQLLFFKIQQQSCSCWKTLKEQRKTGKLLFGGYALKSSNLSLHNNWNTEQSQKDINKFLLTPKRRVDQIHSCAKSTYRREFITMKNTTAICTLSGLQLSFDDRSSTVVLLAESICGGDESIYFPTSQAKLCLQPPDGCISRYCQLLLTATLTTSWDYTLQHLSYLLHPAGASYPTFPCTA